MSLGRLFLGGLLALGFAGCAASPEVARRVAPAPDVPASADLERVRALMKERAVAGAAANYRIGVGDELAVEVLGVKELGDRFRVSEHGRIALPMVPPTKVEGLTIKEASAAIRRSLGEYLQDPVVKVSLAQRTGSQVTVMGAIGEPGSYSLEGFDETLADLITRAGGITAHAGPTLFFFPSGSAGSASRGKRQVASTRAIPLNSEGGPLTEGGVEIDLTRLYRGRSVPELNLPLRAGDAILIPLAGEVFVNGWVTRPGGYPLQMRMTVTEALARAGGLHFGASRGRLQLVRASGTGRPTVLDVSYSEAMANASMDPFLQAGDRLEVGMNPVRAAGWAFYEAIRSFIGFQAGGRIVDEDFGDGNDRRLINTNENAVP